MIHKIAFAALVPQASIGLSPSIGLEKVPSHPSPPINQRQGQQRSTQTMALHIARRAPRRLAALCSNSWASSWGRMEDGMAMNLEHIGVVLAEKSGTSASQRRGSSVLAISPWDHLECRRWGTPPASSLSASNCSLASSCHSSHQCSTSSIWGTQRSYQAAAQSTGKC